MPLKYKIGADPEFSILYDGRRVCADKTIVSLFKSDSSREHDTLETDGGQFGCDGCSSTGELRPKPALEPKEVTANIRKCFDKFFEKGRQFELSTLSLWAPVGGHIHLELPDQRASSDSLERAHKKLISYYLPILLAEQKTNLQIRLRSYGKLEDYRTGDGKPTMEIRTPSAEWLTSEKTARATLAYMTMVWHEIWENPENLDRKILLKTKKQETALQELAVSEFDALTRGLMRNITRNVRQFGLYPQFKEDIEFILRPDRVLAEKKKHNFTVNSGWGYGIREAIPNKRKFLTKQPLIEGNAEFMGVSHNGDMNTASLAEEVGSRVLAGFKPKYSYFFYGLKQGVDDFVVSWNREIYRAPKVCDEEDKDKLVSVAARMADKAMALSGHDHVLKIDFKTAKILQESKKSLAIGVPHKYRAKKNFKPVLELIWDLEKKELAPIAVTVAAKSAVAALPEGDLDVEDTKEDLVLDTDSQGAGYASRAVREVLDEQRLEERENIPLPSRNISQNVSNYITSDKIANLRNILARTLGVRGSYGDGPSFLGYILGVQVTSDGEGGDVLVLRQPDGGWPEVTDRGCLPQGLQHLYWIDSGSTMSPTETLQETGHGVIRYRIDRQGGSLSEVMSPQVTFPIRFVPILEEACRDTGYYVDLRAGESMEDLMSRARDICNGEEDNESEDE